MNQPEGPDWSRRQSDRSQPGRDYYRGGSHSATSPPPSHQLGLVNSNSLPRSHQLRLVEVNSSTPSHQLRLIKINSNVLETHQIVAVVDTSGQGTSIGRDRAFTPRIRLPDMQVSKHHCSLFAIFDDQTRQTCFYVADTGSTYGTFVRSAESSASPSYRLSEPKKASVPHPLRHGDRLTVAKTTFAVHVHPWHRPSCEECALNDTGANEIPLGVHQPSSSSSSSSTASTAPSSSPSAYPASGSRSAGDRGLNAEASRRREMAELKASWEYSHNNPKTPSTVVQAPATEYLDRAAQRRATRPDPSSSSSAAPRRRPDHRSQSRRPLHLGACLHNDADTTSTANVQAADVPLDEHNVGFQMYHRLLPASSVSSSSSSSSSSAAPLSSPKISSTSQANHSRAGIGSSSSSSLAAQADPHSQSHNDCYDDTRNANKSTTTPREESKRRRFEEVRREIGDL